MKWNIFKSKTLSKELRNRNRELSDRHLENRKSSLEKNIFVKSANFFKKFLVGISFDSDIRDQIEEMLIGLDFGPVISDYIAKEVAIKITKKTASEELLKESLKQELLNFYGPSDTDFSFEKGRTNILLVVGSNGTGKTTSIAKIANYFKQQNYKVLLIAGDTFRAGATEQLMSWAQKLQIDICFSEKNREDPSALIYRSLTNHQSSSYDLIICDTSGRQHNNQNLLQELSKIHKTIEKFDSDAPHETLLVVDATTGQSSLLQCEKFLQSAQVTGIILTKMDSVSRGGIIFAIKERLKVPVKLIGTGEKLNDIREFNLEEVVSEWTSSF